jgi:hypothetical protein
MARGVARFKRIHGGGVTTLFVFGILRVLAFENQSHLADISIARNLTAN